MKRSILTLAAALAVAVAAPAQVTLVWNFADDNAEYDFGTPQNFSITGISIGNSLGTVSDPVSTTSASSGYPGASGTGNIGNAVKVGALDLTDGTGSAYFQFTVTPSPGYSITFSDFDFGTRSTSTGPQAYAMRWSVDGFTTDIFSGTIANNSSWAFKDNTFSSVTGSFDEALTFRLYMYNGTGSPASNTINSRLDDISVTLTALAAPIPEPSAYAALLAGLTLVFVAVRRRFTRH